MYADPKHCFLIVRPRGVRNNFSLCMTRWPRTRRWPSMWVSCLAPPARRRRRKKWRISQTLTKVIHWLMNRLWPRWFIDWWTDSRWFIDWWTDCDPGDSLIDSLIDEQTLTKVFHWWMQWNVLMVSADYFFVVFTVGPFVRGSVF